MLLFVAPRIFPSVFQPENAGYGFGWCMLLHLDHFNTLTMLFEPDFERLLFGVRISSGFLVKASLDTLVGKFLSSFYGLTEFREIVLPAINRSCIDLEEICDLIVGRAEFAKLLGLNDIFGFKTRRRTRFFFILWRFLLRQGKAP